MTTYDVHAHCIPAELIELLRADGPRFGIEIMTDDQGESAVIAGKSRLAPFRSILSDTESRLAAMDAAGVQTQLVSSWVDLTAYALAPEMGASYSRRFNQILAEEVSRHPDRLLGLGTVPLQSPGDAAVELGHAVTELGLVGVEIATTIDGVDLDQAGLDPFWEAAEALGCLVLLHPCNPLPGVDLSRNFLDNMVGRPTESTIAVAHLLFSGVIERFPDLVICVVHGGGFIPYQVGRMQRGFDAVPRRTARNIATSPTEMARRLYYDTVLHSPQALAYLVEWAGAEHVLLGSDYPFEMGDPAPVDTVMSIPGLSDDDRGLILGGNLTRILDRIAEKPLE
ncbi:MAG: amidohydrolase family protein [Acidimicrobiia bacterium]